MFRYLDWKTRKILINKKIWDFFKWLIVYSWDARWSKHSIHSPVPVQMKRTFSLFLIQKDPSSARKSKYNEEQNVSDPLVNARPGFIISKSCWAILLWAWWHREQTRTGNLISWSNELRAAASPLCIFYRPLQACSTPPKFLMTAQTQLYTLSFSPSLPPRSQLPQIVCFYLMWETMGLFADKGEWPVLDVAESKMS